MREVVAEDTKVGDRVKMAIYYRDHFPEDYPKGWEGLRGVIVDIQDAGEGWVYEHVKWDTLFKPVIYLRGFTTHE